MIEYKTITTTPFGGDYNPEQWPEDTWDGDLALLKQAHVNILTLNVFSWAILQPSEDRYDFSLLDRIMETVTRHGMNVFLATSTGAVPPWMAQRYPEVMRVLNNGQRRTYGRRHAFCPNSPVYRRFAASLAEKLSERYGARSNVVGWHVGNEYNGACFCPLCEAQFRVWLQKRYGTLDALNRAWNTAFWSHTYHDWSEIVAPTQLNECAGGTTCFQGISLDYNRFMSDSLLECFTLERDAIRRHSDVPVTTNFMGMHKSLDMYRWAREEDFVGWDNYPEYNDEPCTIALRHDVMRSLKGGKPFGLFEQTPSVNNWQEYCRLKRPGVMRLQSYQAVAHGADTVMFFQMKQSRGACEKFHGAVISHACTADTRVFREVAALGEELECKLGAALLGARTKSDVAVLFDWENWWAAEFSAGPSRKLRYVDEVRQFYRALFQEHYSVDMAPLDADLSGYKLVIAPMLYMCKAGVAERLTAYVEAGGTLVSTWFSGYVDESDLVVTGGYPGRLRTLLGLWVEELDAVPPEESNSFVYHGMTYRASLACDLMHLEGAEPLSAYERDFYAGLPVLTKHRYGDGTAYYVGTHADEAFYRRYLADRCEEAGIRPLVNAPADVEATLRENARGRFLFLLNHGAAAADVAVGGGTDLLTGTTYADGSTVQLAPAGVAIIRLA